MDCAEIYEAITYSRIPLFWFTLPLIWCHLHVTLCHSCHLRLHKKCPYSKFFWSAFSRIRIEYEVIRRVSLRIQPNCGKMWTWETPNTDTFKQCKCSNLQYWKTNAGRGINTCCSSVWFRCYNVDEIKL